MSRKHIVIDARIRRASTGRYIDRLLEHVQHIDKDNLYTVLVEPGDDWLPKAQNIKTVACRFKQFSFSPLEQIGFAWQLYKLKANLVHFAMTQQPIFYFGPIVTTTHDLTMLKFTKPGKLPSWLHAIRRLGYRLLFWWGHKKSERIIVPSHYVAEALAKLQPFTKNKIVVTYEAADQLPGTPEPLNAVSKPFILHVGSPFPHKNIERLIQAFTGLRADGKELSLVLAGKKEFYFDQLEAQIKALPYSQDIILPGRISDDELKWLYENAEAYVLPSLSEGFGLPGLEAMLHGCPLVSSNATCLPEIYGRAAHYFDPESVDDMVRAIKAVLEDSALRQKLIADGKKQAAKYSWQRTAEQTLAVYQKVLSKN